MSTKVKLVWGGLIAAVLLLVYFMMSQQWSGWKVYSNARYGFQVEYLNNWQLGAASTNNDGRTFTSQDGEIECRAYGFHNALDQSLDEFIDWMQQDPTTNVLEETKTIMADMPAVQMVLGQGDSGLIGTYVLGEETGYGLVCYVDSPAAVEKHRQVYDHMMESFALENEAQLGQNNCQDFVSGVITPVKDLQTFTDKRYTTVTTTSRVAWDQAKLPKQVVGLEKEGYECMPMPLEFEKQNQAGDDLVQPAVTTVEWNCELAYVDYEYLPAGSEVAMKELTATGYECEKTSCVDEAGEASGVWLCGK